MNRVRAGFCTVPNPVTPKQVTRVSLLPNEVEAIVFWTKDPAPFLPHLGELRQLGFRYYFQFTVNGYPSFFEPGIPALAKVLDTFVQLSYLEGPEAVVWRYDPIIWSNVTGLEYHLRTFSQIAKALRGRTRRVVISLLDPYPRPAGRLRRLRDQGVDVNLALTPEHRELQVFLHELVSIADANGMDVFSCCERSSLQEFGILPGRCIDHELIERLFGIRVSDKKDRSQRPECGCVESRDIGVYGTCRHGCVYCYASHAGLPAVSHDVNSPSLVGWHEAQDDASREKNMRLF